MTYLLDVNALVALGFLQHEFHDRVAAWVKALASKGSARLATCPITELGFARVLTQTAQYQFTLAQARELLLKLKASETVNFTFIPDDHDISRLPSWVKNGKQMMDGRLVELARANGAILAMLDRRIPHVFLIPQAK